MTSHNFLDLTNSDVVANARSKTDTAYVQTANNTATTLWSITVPEQSAVVILALVSGLNNNHSEAITGMVIGGGRRDGGGNVATTGTPTTTSTNDSSGTPSFTIDADTATQTLRLRVTGETSKTLDWYATITYQIITT